MDLGSMFGYVALAVSLLAVALVFVINGITVRQQKRAFAGSKGENVAQLLEEHGRQLGRLELDLGSLAEQYREGSSRLSGRLAEISQDLAEQTRQLQDYAQGALRHSYVHKYGAADGPESAVVVHLDAQGNGTLIDFLVGKTIRVYVREVRNWRAGQLAQEAEEALKKARAAAEWPG